MLRLTAAFALFLGLTQVQAQAQMLDGADDPAFRAALTTLLSSDDPVAVAVLRDLAEAGNSAALVTLPFALLWVPPKGSLKEKNDQRRVKGIAAKDAAAKAHGATALWDMGNMDDAKLLPDRAAGLLALGEQDKAVVLISAWVSQTGGRGDLPPQLLTDDTPAMLAAYALHSRVTDAVYGSGSAQDEAKFLLSLMREDNLAGWVTYVHLLETSPEFLDIIGNPLAGTGLSAADTEARIEDARAVRTVWLTWDDTSTPAAVAARARMVLMDRAEFLPIARLCQAQCPDSLASCEIAALVYPGHSYGNAAGWQPFADVLDPGEFAASDRGLGVMIRPRNDPAAATDLATAEGLDACYAGLLARRDTLVFGR